MKYNLFLILFFIFATSRYSFGQAETAVWYFGDSAGLNFNTYPPTVLTDGVISAREGCSSICDKKGNILFYTNGVKVWNKAHTIMQNGIGLKGNISSTQSCLIVPNPGNDSIYYIFTVADEGKIDGLNYSIVNMNRDNGFGSVTGKNISLHNTVTEKLAGVLHENKRDIWVLAHAWKSDKFIAFLVKPGGIDENYVSSYVGSDHSAILSELDALGCMKFSVSGKKLAVTKQGFNFCELFDFHTKFGKVTNARILITDYIVPYGVEFSPDENLLYVSYLTDIVQFNLNEKFTNSILKSYTHIAHSDELYFSSMQTGPDGRIYISSHPPHNAPDYPSGKFLQVINNPNEVGGECDYRHYGIYLNGRGCQLGLPNFVQSWLKFPKIVYENTCFGDTVHFSAGYAASFDSVQWFFNDRLSSMNYSSEAHPVHYFTKPGKYSVSRKIVLKNGQEDSSSVNVHIFPLPEIELGNDTTFCGLPYWDIQALNTSPIKGQNYSYAWNLSGLDTGSVRAFHTGLYAVTVENQYACRTTDSIYVTFGAIPAYPLGKDTTLCNDDSLVFSSFDTSWTCSMNKTLFDGRYVIRQPGEFLLHIKDTNNCEYSDTMTVSYMNTPEIPIVKDTMMCEGETLTVEIPDFSWQITWNNTILSNSLQISAPGIIMVKATNFCGVDFESFVVNFKSCEEVPEPVPGPSEIQVPNIIVINSAFNNVFKVEGLHVGDNWKFIVFNRWGRLIYESQPYQNNWDGRDRNNKIVQDGVYFYFLLNSKLQINQNGFVHVFQSK